jgi:hypothetical protein
MAGLDLIAHSRLAHLNVLETVTVTMPLASASLDSLEFTAHFLLALHLALVTDDVCQLEHKWLVNAMKASRVMIALREPAPMIAQDTESALVVFAHVRMDGVAMTVQLDAQDTVKDAVEMVNVLKDSATAILDGLVMDVILELACTTALNTDIATTEHASAKKDTEDVIAHFLLSHNHASAQFTACVDACNNAQRSMKHKALDLPMNATQSVPRSVCHSVLLEKCLKTSVCLLESNIVF